MQMWKPEWFRHGKGRGRNADRSQGKNGKGVLMMRKKTAQALGKEKKGEVIQKKHLQRFVELGEQKDFSRRNRDPETEL